MRHIWVYGLAVAFWLAVALAPRVAAAFEGPESLDARSAADHDGVQAEAGSLILVHGGPRGLDAGGRAAALDLARALSSAVGGA